MAVLFYGDGDKESLEVLKEMEKIDDEAAMFGYIQ